uniref:Novel protein similar to vertebrate tripartite motif-containing (TRIM) family n=1 Tax=Dicentrarchus labrax TaxID=13489 RepID=E6ZHR5_DICLA|nr:Novel protein similar to vertebrate tripartite motif-containing (TRIM) family [Dicentrarchus labrax]
MLQCGHSFCRSCVHKHWEKRISRTCPLCQQVTDTEPQTNFTLKNLCENYNERNGVELSGPHQNHPERKFLQRQVSCFSRSLLKKNNCAKNMLQTLRFVISCTHILNLFSQIFKTLRHEDDDPFLLLIPGRSKRRRRLLKKSNNRAQSCNIKQKIKNDFKKLHAFLWTEEETKLAALREEKTQKIRMMKLITEMSRNTLSLSDTVKEMEDLGVEKPFIQPYKMKMERTQKALPDPQQLPQVLINESKHVENLQVRVLESVLSNIKDGKFLGHIKL